MSPNIIYCMLFKVSKLFPNINLFSGEFSHRS